MICELWPPRPDLHSSTLYWCLGSLIPVWARGRHPEPIWPIIRFALRDNAPVQAIAEVVKYGAQGAVDGDVTKVGPAKAGELRVEVRKTAALEQGVVAVFDAGDHVLRALGGNTAGEVHVYVKRS